MPDQELLWLVIIVVVIAVGVVAAMAARRVQHPEDSADHVDTAGDSTSERLHGADDRPAGEEAESRAPPTGEPATHER